MSNSSKGSTTVSLMKKRSEIHGDENGQRETTENVKLPFKKRLQEVMKYLVVLEESSFTGYIRINYTQGSVGRIEKMEEILPKPRKNGDQS